MGGGDQMICECGWVVIFDRMNYIPGSSARGIGGHAWGLEGDGWQVCRVEAETKVQAKSSHIFHLLLCRQSIEIQKGG